MDGQECQQFVVFMVMRERRQNEESLLGWPEMARAGQRTMSV